MAWYSAAVENSLGEEADPLGKRNKADHAEREHPHLLAKYPSWLVFFFFPNCINNTLNKIISKK
jgi:hypothetical protein